MNGCPLAAHLEHVLHSVKTCGQCLKFLERPESRFVDRAGDRRHVSGFTASMALVANTPAIIQNRQTQDQDI